MKKYLFLIAIAFASCHEEEIAPNPIVGSWSLSDPEIQISFDVVKSGRALNYNNVIVNHPAIPAEEQTNNNMICYDKFDNGMGYGRIEITSRGPFYYKVSLIYNRLEYNEGSNQYDLLVYDVQVDIPSEPFFVLQDRVFEKHE